jgi:hypothetical protein
MSTQPGPRTYVVDDGAVTLEVVIGEGQKGMAAILLNGAEVARGQGRVVKNLGSGLAGATVEVFSVVNHTNPDTTRISVMYKWRGGPSPQTDVDSGDFSTDPDPTFIEPTYHLVGGEQAA